MYEYDKTFDRKVFLGQCDLILWFSDFALYLDTQLVYDKTFDRKVFLGHCDLISWFSDFALYLNTEWVYDHISFTL